MIAEEAISLYTELGSMNLAQATKIQARGDCPLCDNPEGHFYVRLLPGTSKKTGKPLTVGMWQCKYCNRQGNQFTLLKEIHESLSSSTSLTTLKPLAEHRSLPAAHLKKKGVVYSPLTREYLVPVRNQQKAIINFVRYDIDAASPKPYNLSALSLAPFGLEAFPLKRPSLKNTEGKSLPPICYILEGIWDYLAFSYLVSEYLRTYKETYNVSPPEEDRFYYLGSPGVNFPDDYVSLLKGYEVRILFDNDKAGIDAVPRLHTRLKGTASSSLHLSWPETAIYKDKDVRDLITQPELIA